MTFTVMRNFSKRSSHQPATAIVSIRIFSIDNDGAGLTDTIEDSFPKSVRASTHFIVARLTDIPQKLDEI